MKQKYQSLNAVKAVAVIMIVVYHYNVHSLGNSDYRYPFMNNMFIRLLSERGYLLVELLFMLSGFLICHGYKDCIQNNEIDFWDYIIKRLKRLYPLFIVTTVFMCLVDLIHHYLTGQFVFNLYYSSQMILNILFIQTGWFSRDTSGNHIAWYLSVLFFCYLLFYYITKKVDRKNFYKVNMILAFIGLSFMIMNLPYPFINAFMARGVACFSIGIILYKLNNLFTYKFKKVICYFGGCGLLTITILSYEFGYSRVIGDYRITMILFFSPLIILAAINIKIIKRILETKLLLFLGSISYSIYLWQIVVRVLLEDINIIWNLNLNYEKVWVFLMYLSILIATSIISHYFLEGIVMKKLLNKLSISMCIDRDRIGGWGGGANRLIVPYLYKWPPNVNSLKLIGNCKSAKFIRCMPLSITGQSPDILSQIT